MAQLQFGPGLRFPARWRRLPLLRRGFEPGAGLTAPLQRFQSGVVNDYVTWIVLGLAAIGGVLALIIR